VFERDLKNILSGEHIVPENSSEVHVMAFILRETSDSEVARKVLGWMSENMNLNYAPAPWCTKSDDVVELIVEALERNKLWRCLKENMAEVAFHQAMTGRWQSALSALERNVATINDPTVLAYIGRATNSLHTAGIAVDNLRRDGHWEAIESIAAATETTIVMKTPAPFGIGDMSRTATVERANAPEIAAYAAKTIQGG
jgi:predicted ArsR family transcriptional regulator